MRSVYQYSGWVLYEHDEQHRFCLVPRNARTSWTKQTFPQCYRSPLNNHDQPSPFSLHTTSSIASPFNLHLLLHSTQSSVQMKTSSNYSAPPIWPTKYHRNTKICSFHRQLLSTGCNRLRFSWNSAMLRKTSVGSLGSPRPIFVSPASFSIIVMITYGRKACG